MFINYQKGLNARVLIRPTSTKSFSNSLTTSPDIDRNIWTFQRFDTNIERMFNRKWKRPASSDELEVLLDKLVKECGYFTSYRIRFEMMVFAAMAVVYMKHRNDEGELDRDEYITILAVTLLAIVVRTTYRTLLSRRQSFELEIMYLISWEIIIIT